MRKPIISMYERLLLTPTGYNEWVLQRSFIYFRNYKGNKHQIFIPKGFKFDGASIPHIFYLIGTPMATDTLLAALVHDYIYKVQTMTRQEADELFNEIMIICEVFWIKRTLYYLGVRLGGWVAWKKHKKSLQK